MIKIKWFDDRKEFFDHKEVFKYLENHLIQFGQPSSIETYYLNSEDANNLTLVKRDYEEGENNEEGLVIISLNNMENITQNMEIENGNGDIVIVVIDYAWEVAGNEREDIRHSIVSCFEGFNQAHLLLYTSIAPEQCEELLINLENEKNENHYNYNLLYTLTFSRRNTRASVMTNRARVDTLMETISQLYEQNEIAVEL